MKIKKIPALLLTIVMVMNLCATVYAADPLPQFAITDDVVVIEYVPYKISDGKIQFNNRTYEVKDSFLVTYDDEGPIYLILPVEQNRVTDPEEIAKLNAMAGLGNQLGRAVPENAIDLPYSASVPKGKWDVITPTFKVIEQQYSYYLNLKITGLPFIPPKPLPGSNIGVFNITLATCDKTGTWTRIDAEKVDFGHGSDTLKLINGSNTNFGFISITNLYGNPSPAYNYQVFKSAFG